MALDSRALRLALSVVKPRKGIFDEAQHSVLCRFHPEIRYLQLISRVTIYAGNISLAICIGSSGMIFATGILKRIHDDSRQEDKAHGQADQEICELIHMQHHLISSSIAEEVLTVTGELGCHACSVPVVGKGFETVLLIEDMVENERNKPVGFKQRLCRVDFYLTAGEA